jgi:hypothetical protein
MENNSTDDILSRITPEVLDTFTNDEIKTAEKIRTDLRAEKAAKKAAAETTSEQTEENQANTPPESRPPSPRFK